MEFKIAPKIRTTVELTPEFYKMAKINNIRFSEAMRVGISMILAEKGIKEYDNNLNLYRKMRFYQQELENILEKAKVNGVKETKVDGK